MLVVNIWKFILRQLVAPDSMISHFRLRNHLAHHNFHPFSFVGLIEGDIVDDENFEILTGRMAPRGRRDTLSDRLFHWENAVVPYEIANDMCKFYNDS